MTRPRAFSQEMNPDWQHNHCPLWSAVSGSATRIG
jgi:hypothetical protein